MVDKVDGGIAGTWNAENPNKALMAGDRVMSANGVAGDAVELTQVCKRDDIIEMEILRDPESYDRNP